MPHEPQHPMEPALRGWAATRRQRAGVPFELAPADRARLQEEVSRTVVSAGHPAPAWVLAWRRFFPRLALGLGAVGVVLLIVLKVAPPGGDSSLELARRDGSPEPSSMLLPHLDPLEQPADSPADVGSEPLASALSVGPESAEQPPSEGERLGAPPPPLMLQRYGLEPRARPVQHAPRGTAPSASPSLSDSGERLLVARPANELPAAPAGAPTLAAAPVGRETAESLERGSLGAAAARPPDWAGAFARPQAPRRNINAPPDYALRSFRLEKRGATLRLLDEDGSVYEGIVLGEQPLAVTPSTTSWAAGLVPPGGIGFRVSGTNRSTRQSLVFQGVLVTGATVRIQGHALLGGRDRVVVDAPGTVD